jgi:hypothetical protein
MAERMRERRGLAGVSKHWRGAVLAPHCLYVRFGSILSAKSDVRNMLKASLEEAGVDAGYPASKSRELEAHEIFICNLLGGKSEPDGSATRRIMSFQKKALLGQKKTKSAKAAKGKLDAKTIKSASNTGKVIRCGQFVFYWTPVELRFKKQTLNRVECKGVVRATMRFVK